MAPIIADINISVKANWIETMFVRAINWKAKKVKVRAPNQIPVIEPFLKFVIPILSKVITHKIISAVALISINKGSGTSFTTPGKSLPNSACLGP